jgi:hypothetical protein
MAAFMGLPNWLVANLHFTGMAVMGATGGANVLIQRRRKRCKSEFQVSSFKKKSSDGFARMTRINLNLEKQMQVHEVSCFHGEMQVPPLRRRSDGSDRDDKSMIDPFGEKGPSTARPAVAPLGMTIFAR